MTEWILQAAVIFVPRLDHGRVEDLGAAFDRAFEYAVHGLARTELETDRDGGSSECLR
tara:strand:- start:2066 stop:2239 length:174 start_codon:yes stop_codon:yes gene_type:complete